MDKIAIFYGSSTGNTKTAANAIAKQLNGYDVYIGDIANAEPSHVSGFNLLIFGVSTWGYGDIQDDWEIFLPNLEKMDLTGKTIALFGLGDAEAYPDTFVDAMGDLYETVVKNGARVVGQVPVDGYNFSESRAVIDGRFAGLPLDEDNESDMSSTRIENWVSDLKSCFN
ncbi:flavodoxin [Natronoflexus pectinivorans]|uniref:Flavodoxin n=1 Tax=Natronoflexus pectinivorans TaxID=682526 RepID=A0A4V2RVX7_9BACT|nr:flavodoxin [Natronoflexus pectinivorans]TCO06054.1 flavodoxin I [Natronoflexus pectinivorans]